MKFPVDLLAHVSQEELERSAQNYMNTLLHSNPDSAESITLSDSTEVIINISTVGFVPLYGSSDRQKILALFTSTDPFTAVALYLLNQWWAISEILKTEDNDRNGAVEVQTVGERLVLYSLNRVIYRAKEMSSEELPFLCHGETDYAKILWHNGEAVGFYSVKLSGSLCSSFSTRSYQLPVMDSIYVRKCHRGNGYGLQMLKDYVLSFTESCLGLRYPLTTAMYKVCQKYLSQYPGDADLLWEVQSIGGPNQRTNIANKIQVMDLSAVLKKLLYTEEPVVIMEEIEEDTTTIKEAESVKCTVEILEEVTVVKEADDVPFTTWDRSNGSKQWKIGENVTENKMEKVIRIKDIEAESPREDHVSEQQKTEEHDISEHEDMLSVTTEGKAEVEAGKDSASMLDKTTTVQASGDLESESTVASAAEACRAEDKDLCGVNALCDSQIAIENVVAETEEGQREVLDTCKEAETVEMEWEAKNEACEEELDEIVIQQVKCQSTHATSANQLTSHRKAEKDNGRVLRGRTVVGSLATKCKATQQSEKVGEKSESDLSLAKEVVELAQTEGQCGRNLTAATEGEAVKENNKTDQEQKNDEVERSLIGDEAKESDGEKEPPVVQRRPLRARSKATPSCKSRSHSKRHQKQQNDLESQEFAMEENSQQQVQEHKMEQEDPIYKPQNDIPAVENNYVENKLDVTLSTEENMQECKEVREEGKTQELTDTVVEEGKEEEEAGTLITDLTEKCDSFGEANEAREQNLTSVVSAGRTKEPSKKSAGNSDILKLHKAAVMLVDMKAACLHLQVKNTEEIQATKINTAKDEEIILTEAGAFEKKDQISVVEQKELESQQVEKVVEEETTEDDYGKDMENCTEFEEKHRLLSETFADKEDCTVPNAQQSTPLPEENEGISLDKEKVPLVQTRALTSGTITVIDISGHNRVRKAEGQLSEAGKTHQKTEGKAKKETVEGEELCFELDVELQQEKGVAGEPDFEQNIAKEQSVAITENVADKVVDVSGEVLQDGEDVEEKTMTGSGQEYAGDLTTAADDSKGGAPEYQNETAAVSSLVKTTEEEKILTVEAEQREIVSLQLTDLPRLSVVLVDLKKSQHGVQAEADVELAQEETSIEITVPGSFAVIAETRQGTKEKEVSVVTTHYLHVGKTAKALPGDQDMVEEKSTEGDETAKETRLLKGGIKSTSATPRRVERRMEEKLETEPLKYTEIEETIAEETQDGQDEKMEEKEETESTTQTEHDKELEADLETIENIVQELVSEQDASKDTVKGTIADESLDNKQTTDKVQAVDEEEAPAANTTRVVRSGKKCAVTISRRISKRTGTQSQTEEDDVEEGSGPIKNIQREEAISKETQHKQEEMPENSEKVNAARADNKESETEVEREAGAEKSLSEQDAIEETPPIQSVEDIPTTEEANTTSEENIRDTWGDKSNEEDEPAKATRLLRHGRKSASATQRHKSKRDCIQLEKEKVEEDTAPTKKIPLEGGISKEIQENKTDGSEKADAPTQKEDAQEAETEIQNQAVVAEESLPEQGPVEEAPPTQSVEDLPTREEAKATNALEIPVLARRVLSRGEKIVKATQDDQDTATDEAELAKETRDLRHGRNSASPKPMCKSKKAHTQFHTAKKDVREYTASAEELQEGAISTEEKEDNQEEKMEKKEKAKKEDNKVSEADEEIIQNVQELVSEQGGSKNTVKGTVADESLDNIQTTDKVQAADEEASAAKTIFLESDQMIKATRDEKEEEEKHAEEGKPVREIRVLRSGKKCAVTISRRICKRTGTQSQTEEDDVEEGTAPIKKIKLEEAKSKETQHKQEEMPENSEKVNAARADNKESETEVEREAGAEKSLSEQDAIEETPPIQSVEDIQTTEEANTTNEEDITGTEEDKGTEKDEPVKETRVLRHGRKSASATTRHKSKRQHKQLETEEDEVKEDATSTKKIPPEGSISKEIQEEQTEVSEMADAATQKDAKEAETEVQNQAVVAEKSLPENGPEETPAIPSVEDLPTINEAKATEEGLSKGQNAVTATQDDQDTATEEDEFAKETRDLRHGRNSASGTPRHKSKKAHTQPHTEEKDIREYTASAEELQVGELSTEEKEDNQEEKMGKKEKDKKEDNKVSEADEEIIQNVQESVSEQGGSKNTVKGTVADESLDNIQTTDKVQAAGEEEASAAKTNFLESDQKTMKATQAEEEEEEKDSEEGQPVIETRVLRSGKKCAVTIFRRISKRTGTQSQTEEDDVVEGTAPIKKIHREEAISKETQHKQEEMTKNSEKADATRADNKESETGVEKEAVAKESLLEQGAVEQTPPAQSVEDLPTTEEVNITNEEDITDTEEDKSTEPTKERKVVCHGRKSASATPRHQSKRECKQPQMEGKEENEAAASSEYIQIEKTIDEETQYNQEEKTEDRSKDETTTQKEEAVAKSIPKPNQIEDREDETNKEETILIKMTDTKTSCERGDDLNLEVDTYEEIEKASLNQEKEDEQSLSEEDEQIVIRGKVLRGRSVPSMIITPKSRRHSPKVQKAKESSSGEDPEHKPKRRQSAKRSSQKRQSSEITPNRWSKRHRI